MKKFLNPYVLSTLIIFVVGSLVFATALITSGAAGPASVHAVFGPIADIYIWPGVFVADPLCESADCTTFVGYIANILAFGIPAIVWSIPVWAIILLKRNTFKK
jgi:hypothetical protein